MTEFSGKVEIQDTNPSGPYTKITLDGETAMVALGSNGSNGDIIFYDGDGKERMKIGVEESLISAQDSSGKKVFGVYDNRAGGIWLVIGTDKITMDGTRGEIFLDDEDGKRSLAVRGKDIDGKTAAIFVGSDPTAPKAGYMAIRSNTGNDSIVLDGANNSMALRDEAGRNSINIDGAKGDMTLYDKDGHRGFALLSKAPSLSGNTTGMWIGASKDEGQKAGYIVIRDSDGNDSIELDGRSGDIILNNADCAEDFDIAESAEIEPGTVMVIDQDGKLRQSNMPYDKRVAGVVSGAQNYKPGLVLDKRKSTSVRKSVSLMGKVYCKADSQYGSIEVGDLLTTSDTPGHAMKATDPMKAFGSVIGKALGSLNQEIGLIPILVSLQ